MLKWLLKREVIGFTGFFAVVLVIFDLIYGRDFNSELLLSRLSMVLAIWVVYAFIERSNAKRDQKKKAR